MNEDYSLVMISWYILGMVLFTNDNMTSSFNFFFLNQKKVLENQRK